LEYKFKGVVNKEKLKTRHETIDGVKYLIAPAVMVAEAVLNGELLPAEEIQRSCEGWNGRLLTVKHPQDDDGNDVSANSPEMIEKFGAGYIFSATYDPETTKLKCEIYFDISKKNKSPEHKAAYSAITNGKPLEVSTGYFVTEPIDESGEKDGEKFDGVQSNILPDHFALLPGDVGAFSWEDGGGVRNNRRKKQKTISVPMTQHMLLHASKIFPSLKKYLKSNNQVNPREALHGKLLEVDSTVGWIVDIMYDTEEETEFCVYEKRVFDENGNEIWDRRPLYRRDFSVESDTGEIALSEVETEVSRATSYIAANAVRTQIMLADEVLRCIQDAHPDVKVVDELYFDAEDGCDYAVFSKNKAFYKVPYTFDRKTCSVAIGETATQVQPAMAYFDTGHSPRARPGRETVKSSRKCKTPKQKRLANK